MWTWERKQERKIEGRGAYKEWDNKINDDATETMAGADGNISHGKEDEEVEKIHNDNMRKAYETRRMLAMITMATTLATTI